MVETFQEFRLRFLFNLEVMQELIVAADYATKRYSRNELLRSFRALILS